MISPPAGPDREEWPASFPARTGSLGRWKVPLVVCLLLVGLLLRIGAVQHHRAVDYDEGRYLDNAVNILKGRGFQTHYTSHFFRPQAAPLHPEDISSPLYPYLLAVTFLLAEPGLGAAQIWSLLPACLMLLLTFILGERLLGERPALLAALLVALNPDMVILSSWAMTESLYGALFLGILLLAVNAASPMRWCALGIACGLLYLLRANGLAVAAGIGFAALVTLPSGAWSLRRLAAPALFAACFVAVISPWLIRNQQIFGSPTYTAMKHVAWSESGRDLFTRNQPPPSLQAFREEHGEMGLLKNLARRAWRAARYMVWGDAGAYNLVCVLFPVVLVLTWRQRRLAAGNLCVLFSAMLLAGVPTWTGALSRYMLPLRPWIYLVVIGTVLQVAPALAWRRNLRRASRGGMTSDASRGEIPMSTEPARRITAAMVASLIALVAWASTQPLEDFLSRDEADRDAVAREAALWIEDQTPPGSVLLEGAYIHQYAYLFDRAVVWVPTGGLDEVSRAASDYGARHLVVSAELIRSRPELAEHFASGPEGIEALDLPSGLKEVFAGTGRKLVIWEMPEGRP